MANQGQPTRIDTQLFYEAFKASPIGIALENLEGQPLFANPALCSMLGFSEQELRDKHCVELSPPEDAKKDWTFFMQLREGLISKYQIEKRFFRRDGSLIWGRLTISLLESKASPVVVAMVEDITESRALRESLSKVSQRLIEAQEQERASISRELHDDVTQRVVLATVKLERLRKDLTPPEAKLRKGINDVIEQLNELGTDIQALSHRLHSSRLQQLGLQRAAASFCEEFSDRHKVSIEFQSDGVLEDLPIEISLCLFRVLQEALQNAMKHSGSRDFQVSVATAPDEVQLSVRDSGKGFDVLEAFKTEGIGLASMRERLKLVDGQLSLQTAPGRGTVISARVPWSPGAASSP